MFCVLAVNQHRLHCVLAFYRTDTHWFRSTATPAEPLSQGRGFNSRSVDVADERRITHCGTRQFRFDG